MSIFMKKSNKILKINKLIKSEIFNNKISLKLKKKKIKNFKNLINFWE